MKTEYSSITGARKYIIDIVGDLPVILVELEGSTVKKKYVYANSQILSQYDSDTSSWYYYLHDRLGSVRQLIKYVSPNVDVVKLYTFDPFGNTLEKLEDDSNMKNPWRFTGQFFDSEIDEYYLRARMYDPYISRFTSRDPVTGKFEEPLTLHKYLYCTNDPLNWTDPDGLDKYLAFDWGHLYVAVDVWSGGRVIGQQRYDFSAPHTWYFWLGLFLIRGEINTDWTDIEMEQEDSWLAFTLSKEQGQEADKRMKAFLDYQVENPPLYNVGWFNCWHWAFVNYFIDYEE